VPSTMSNVRAAVQAGSVLFDADACVTKAPMVAVVPKANG
jgi:hypothetical protein